MKNKKSGFKSNNAKDLNNYDDCDNSSIVSANEHLGGSPLSIKETLIWLEESKIFFYRIKQSIESKKNKSINE